MGQARFQKLVMASFTEPNLPDEVWREVEDCAEAVVRVVYGDVADKSAPFTTELAEADALILKLGQTADVAVMDAAPDLRYIGVYGTGYAEVDVAEAKRRGITVCNIPDYSTQGVAEFTIACILADLRELHRAAAAAEAGDFSEASYTGRDLGALRAGVVGAGAIGTRVARLIHEGFGSATRYWSRAKKPLLDQAGVTYAPLDELMSTCDVVSLHLESNDDTRGFVGATQLGRLKPGALLVCTVPMDVIAYEPLLDALRREAFRFAFDHPDEMDAAEAEALAALPTVTAYPPIGYTTEQSTRRKYRIFVESLAGYVSGSPVHTVT